MRLLIFLAALVLASGCDFSPTLDIETPAYRPALALTGVLFADSTVSLRVTQSEDPYAPRSSYRTEYKVLQTATVTLSRDGGPAEALFFRSRPCNSPSGLPPEQNECGAFASATPLRGGETVTVRAEAPGVAPVMATVTIPVRVSVTATMERAAPLNGLDTDRITARFADAPGEGQRYSLDALLGATRYRGQVCTQTAPRVCRDTVYTSSYVNQSSFSTQDPVLVASLRGVPGNTNVVTFTDELFDGQEHAFTLDARTEGDNTGSGQIGRRPRIVRLLSISEALYQAYQQSFYSLGDANPFQEPSDLPSNVTGGYGLVGAAAVTEVVFP